MLFVSQEERRASDTVLFTSENNDIANQSVDTLFFTEEKNRMTNQLASPARRDYFYLDAFWRVNLGMYIIDIYVEVCLDFSVEQCSCSIRRSRARYILMIFIRINIYIPVFKNAAI